MKLKTVFDSSQNIGHVDLGRTGYSFNQFSFLCRTIVADGDSFMLKS